MLKCSCLVENKCSPSLDISFQHGAGALAVVGRAFSFP